MITKLFQFTMLGLVLCVGNVAAKDQSSVSLVQKSVNSHLTEKEQSEALALRDHRNAVLSANQQTPESSYPPTACDPFPLPTDPIGPAQTFDTERGGQEFYLTQWRYPCNEEFSWVVFTIEPKTALDRACSESHNILIIID